MAGLFSILEEKSILAIILWRSFLGLFFAEYKKGRERVKPSRNALFHRCPFVVLTHIKEAFCPRSLFYGHFLIFTLSIVPNLFSKKKIEFFRNVIQRVRLKCANPRKPTQTHAIHFFLEKALYANLHKPIVWKRSLTQTSRKPNIEIYRLTQTSRKPHTNL